MSELSAILFRDPELFMAQVCYVVFIMLCAYLLACLISKAIDHFTR